MTGVKAALRLKYEPAKQAFNALLVSAREFISDYLAEAVTAEEDFFAQFELEREQTVLTRNIEAKLKFISDTIKNRNSTGYGSDRLPNINSDPFSQIFGVKFEH